MKPISLFFFIAIIVFGCKRYEENPAIVLKSVLERINGKWVVESTTLNSFQVSIDVDSLKTDYYIFSFSSKKEVRHLNLEFNGGISTKFKDSNQINACLANLSKDKKVLSFWSLYPNTSFPIGNIPGTINNSFQFSISVGYYLRETWTIIKLTDKEMWLTSDFNGNSFETHFKKSE